MTRTAPVNWAVATPRRGSAVGYLGGPAAALFFAACGTVLGFGSPASKLAQVMVAACMVLPALYLAVERSTHLLPYVLTLYMVAPEVRRVLDWSGNTYTSVTLISLIPMAATLALAWPVAVHWHRLPRPLKVPVGLLAVACAYASGIGLVLHGVAAVPEALGWGVPLLVLAYIGSRPADRAEREGWLWAFAGVAVGVSAYTWLQFVTAPPWDMDWLVHSGMTSSMGQPLPLQFRAFGPLNSTGAAGFYFPFVIAAVWTARPLRNGLGAITGVLAASALLITQVRSGWLMTAAMLVAGVVVRAGGSWWRQMAALVCIGGLLVAVVPLLPGGDRVQTRLQTFGDLANDNSAQARAQTTQALLAQVAHDPVGTGFGAGAEGKVSGKSAMVGGIDNGFIAIGVYFGWVGGALFFTGVAMLGRLALVRISPAVAARSRVDLNAELRPLAVATLLGMLVGTVAFTAFAGVSAYVGWMLYGTMFAPAARPPVRRPPRVAAPAGGSPHAR